MSRRVIVIGSGGFVGSAIQDELEDRGWDSIGIARRDVDLISPVATDRLMALVRDGDTVVFSAADAPCKSFAQLEKNLKMFGPLIELLSSRRVTKVVYVSSDAVYADSDKLLTENSAVVPTSIHGVMHALRESLLRLQPRPWLILRPTLIFGAADPHNGYGPNKFIRDALAGRQIEIFGDGAELRDHIHISQVAYYSALAIENLEGTLNLATGSVSTFREIAEHAVRISDSTSGVVSVARTGPVPHNGYRSFDIRRLMRDLGVGLPVSVLKNMERDVSNYGK